jgi:hypothetical protein
MSTQNHPLPLHHPSTQTLSTIAEGSEYSTFGNIPEVQLYQPDNMFTTAAGSRQNDVCTRSTQTNGGAPHQSPPGAPSPIQIIQDDIELDQVEVQDWDEEAYEYEAAEEEELIRVQQGIETLY